MDDGEFNLSNTIGIGLNIGEQMLLPVSNGEEEEQQQLLLHQQHQLQHQQHDPQQQTPYAPDTLNVSDHQQTTNVSCLENPMGNFYQESTDLEDLNAKLAETTNLLQYTTTQEKPTELLVPPVQQDSNIGEQIQQLQPEFENSAGECEKNNEEIENVKEPTEDIEGGEKCIIEVLEHKSDEEDVIEEVEDEVEAEDDAEAEIEEEEDDAVEEEEEIIPDEVIVPENTETKHKPIDETEDDDKDKEEEEEETNQAKSENEDSPSEEPTSSTRASRRKEEEVDENQCRVCCAKENLVSIFKNVEGQTVAVMLMTICPSVSIVVKDFLPQYICNACYDNVIIAIKLKSQCETTEKELRKKLSRHKNKIRRPVGYVVIDAPLDSDPPTDEEPANDEEFKVSDIASVTPSEDSETSEFSDSKKKKTRARKRRKSAVVTPTDGKKSKNKTKSDNQTSDEDDDNADPIKHRRKRSSNSSPENFACDECDQAFSRKQSLVLHKRQHVYDRGEPIKCEVCGKKFKIKGAYRTHLEKHKEERRNNKCAQCSRRFNNSTDLKRHIAEEHREKGILPTCSKCNRTFASAGRLQRHKQGGCPNMEAHKPKKPETNPFAVGTDLFKAVAPLQTTYWSDSFSD